MKINVAKVQQQVADEAVRVKPLPRVKVGGKKSVGNKQHAIRSEEKIKPSETKSVHSEDLASELAQEMGALKRERGKLSTQICRLVSEIDRKLSEENRELAEEFRKGNLPMPELGLHYAKIEALTDQMAIVYDKQQHVEQYGELPVIEPKSIQLNTREPELDALHYEVRRLDDLIYKTNQKLLKHNAGLKQPKNTDRVLVWKEKIALADARRNELKDIIKRKQYEQRGQRVGSEQI